MNRLSHWLLKVVVDSDPKPITRIVRFVLYGISKVYSLIIGCRNWAYDRQWIKSMPVVAPVISIGNLTVGGTGKTPIVIQLAKSLRNQYSIAIVSRGYGRNQNRLNDEGREIQQKIPWVVQVQNPDRVQASQSAIELLSEKETSDSPLILLDDGFQHRRLSRDLDILVIDSTNPFGLEYLIPRGLLREPKTAISRANFAIITRCEQSHPSTISNIEAEVLRHNRSIKIYRSRTTVVGYNDGLNNFYTQEFLKGKKLLAFCGIGNPKAFFQTLARENLQVVEHLIFPDHHNFQSDDLDHIHASAKTKKCDAIVCTQKDLVKLTIPPHQIPIVALEIGTQIGQQEEIVHQIIEKLSELKDSRRDQSSPTTTHR
ncbi:MAG: tetraacyldisaccharide 4'-kinase [Planctomycetota bacterium]